MKKSLRLIELQALLRDRPRTIPELAERFGVSKVTVWRDLQDLQGEPIWAPLVKDACGRWHYARV